MTQLMGNLLRPITAINEKLSSLSPQQESFTYRCAEVNGIGMVFAHDPYVSEVTYTCDSYGMIPPGITFKPCTDEPTCKLLDRPSKLS